MTQAVLLQLSLLFPIQVDAQSAREKVPIVKATQEQIRFVKLVSDILGTVQNKDSCVVAVRRLKALHKDALVQWSNSQNLAASGEAISDSLRDKLRDDYQLAARAFHAELNRIKLVPGWPDVRQEVQALWLAMYRGIESDQVPNWRWSDENASLSKCVAQHLAGYSVEFAKKGEFYTAFKIVEQSAGRVVYSCDRRFNAHREIVLTRWKDTMFISNHCARSRWDARWWR